MQKPLVPGIVVLLAGLLISCGSRSRSPDDVSPLETRKSLPAVSVAHDAGAPVGRPASGTVKEVPRALSFDAFAEGDRIGDLAALALDERVLLAWVTYFDPGVVSLPRRAGGASKESKAGAALPATPSTGATVMVRALDGRLEPLAPANLISVKADSVGGVALAEGSNEDEVGLAWVGKDLGLGQVFVTRLSRSGDKQMQRMVTHSKSGCSDVALAKLTDGWVVGWAEQQRGTAAVYVARVGRDLQRVGTERRVAETRGEASQVSLLSSGEGIIVAWSETRTDDALSGVYAARLAVDTLAVRGDPARIALTPGRARDLGVGRLAGGFVFAWVEGVEGRDAASPQNTIVLSRVDAGLKSAVEPFHVATGADPSSLALGCNDRSCNVVAPGVEQGDLALYGFSYDGARPAKTPVRLTTIAGVSTEDISPVLLGNWLLFAEDNLHGRGRVRKLEIAWH